MTTSVCLQRCPTYAASGEAVPAALEAAGLLAGLRRRRVLLKPNMMKGAAPERCRGTHPAFVAAIVARLVADGSEVLVGDSSGLLGFTAEVMAASGLTAAVRAAGGTIVNLDAGPFVTVTPPGRPDRRFLVPRLLAEVDAVVQVPKLKVHRLTAMSAAVKNLMGVLPGATKCDLHVAAPEPHALAGRLLDLAAALAAAGVPLAGAVVDAVWALAGEGPGGEPIVRRPGLVVAGLDLHAVDLACAGVMGLDAAVVPTLAVAIARGLSPRRLADVRLAGDGELPPGAPFPRAPAGLKERSALASRLHYWLRGRLVRPVHDPARCAGHRACVEVCPTRCLSLRDGRVVVDGECVRCLACAAVCPSGAMRLTAPWPLQGLLRQRAEGLDVGKLA
jgi:uncharacterized protein (DUF362 family)/ferredoxin